MALLTAVAVVVLAAVRPSVAPQDRSAGKPCTSSELDEGKEEARKAEPNLRAAFRRISRGIAALEHLDGRGGRQCRVQLAEAYVYLAACVWRIEAVKPNKADDDENRGLSVEGFQGLQGHAVALALEHAVLLDRDSARATLGRLETAEVIDNSLKDMVVQAEAFVDHVVPAAGKPTGKAGPPEWLVLAVGGFLAKQPHRGDSPMFGPHAFAGVGSRRGLSAGPIVGWSFGGGSTAVVGFALRFGVSNRVGVTAGFGWRKPTRSDERTLHGFGVGGTYRFGGS